MNYAEWMNQHLLTTGNLPSHWTTWQAAERQALERAAERCMSILGYPPREYYAKAIRELIEQSASKEKQHG